MPDLLIFNKSKPVIVTAPINRNDWPLVISFSPSPAYVSSKEFITSFDQIASMRIFNLQKMAQDSGGEHVLGLKDLGTHAVYMIYGFLSPGEENRKLLPGKGHEEILCIVVGEVLVKTPAESFPLKKGEAFHLAEDDEFYLSNSGDLTAIYVMAGGHPPVKHD
jgi:hypothetical protein